MIGVLVLAICLTAVPSATANPYDLCGEGNCVYFCWEMMNRFWPTTFQIERCWDAKDWVKLDGQTKEGYQAYLIDLEKTQPRDFIIFPSSSNWSRGHVCFVLDVNDKNILVLESSDYANWCYPSKIGLCRFRVHDYRLDMLKSRNAKGLTYSWGIPGFCEVL